MGAIARHEQVAMGFDRGGEDRGIFRREALRGGPRERRGRGFPAWGYPAEKRLQVGRASCRERVYDDV